MTLGYVPHFPSGSLLFTAIAWRYLLNGAVHKINSIEEVYGHVGGRKRNLFGERIGFASIALFGGSLSPEEVLIRHTLFGVYSRTLAKHTADSWAQNLVNGRQRNGHLPVQLQRGTFRKLELTTTSLRSCRSCVEKDMDEQGFASWRILHTLPPVHHCPYHGDALITEAEGKAGRNIWDLRLPTGVPIHPSNQHFECASDGYAAYLRLWIDLLNGNLPVLEATSWARCMNVVAERMGSVGNAINELSNLLTMSWNRPPDRLPEVLGNHIQVDFLRLELEHRSTPNRIAQKLVILGACELHGIVSAKELVSEQLTIPLGSGGKRSLRESRERLICDTLLHVGFPMAIAPGLASGLSTLSVGKSSGVHRHRVQRAIDSFSESTLEELSSLGTWPVDSWLAKELARRRRR